MEYELIRSGRKTLALTIDKSGKLIVRAPYKFPQSRIEEFIKEKSEWIEKHSAAASERTEQKNERLALPPSELPLFGKLSTVSHEKPYGYIGGCIHLPENMTLEALLPYLRKLYGAIAKETLVPRTYAAAERMGFEVTAVRINSAKTRWGSCSAQKSVNLSRMLIAADPELIDYVIVHELCHTVHMDHSPDFWALVGRYIPDFKERREALKAVQKTISEYGLDK
ncbi:MAG: M48 family metallopeptidase [Huintestinicola sp.]|uniref:M48 family metallopeptidase n=1 Tax=Huintestinicola sp. TaxID=2981661 RepID=UPI003F0066C9